MPLVKDLADLFMSKLEVYEHAKIMTLNLRNLHSVQIHIYSSALVYAIVFFLDKYNFIDEKKMRQRLVHRQCTSCISILQKITEIQEI